MMTCTWLMNDCHRRFYFGRTAGLPVLSNRIPHVLCSSELHVELSGQRDTIAVGYQLLHFLSDSRRFTFATWPLGATGDQGATTAPVANDTPNTFESLAGAFLLFRFLWGTYRPSVYFYEVWECVRKLFLTGLLVYFAEGTATQVGTIGAVISRT